MLRNTKFISRVENERIGMADARFELTPSGLHSDDDSGIELKHYMYILSH